ncbi:hypothetical protein VTO58DRAFT_107504 [Aureobasidium pullulans]
MRRRSWLLRPALDPLAANAENRLCCLTRQSLRRYTPGAIAEALGTARPLCRLEAYTTVPMISSHTLVVKVEDHRTEMRELYRTFRGLRTSSPCTRGSKGIVAADSVYFPSLEHACRNGSTSLRWRR